MKITCPLAPFNWNLGIATAIHNSHSIPIRLGTVGHESSKLWHWDSMSFYDMIRIVPKNHLSILVLGLEVAVRYGHDMLICPVVHMTRHGGPSGYSLDMIGHDPCVL